MGSLHQSVEATEAFASAEVEDERVLLNTETGMYYGLNPIGDRVLRMVEETAPVPIQDIVDHLHSDFPDADYKRIREDVLTFVEEMEEANLLRTRD